MTRGRLIQIVVLTLAVLLLTGGCRLKHTGPRLIRGGHQGHSATSSAPNDGTVHGQRDNPSDPQLGSPAGPCVGGSVTVVPGRSKQVDVLCNAR